MVTVRRNRDQVQFAEPDPALGPDGVGKRAHLCRVTLEHHALQAVVMVQVHVKGRDHQIVMLVADLGQPLGQRSDVVVVDVGEVAHTVPVGGCVPALCDGLADEVPHRLGTALVALAGDEAVERLR